MKLFKTREEREIERINKITFKMNCKILKLTRRRIELEKRIELGKQNNLRTIQGGLINAKPF